MKRIHFETIDSTHTYAKEISPNALMTAITASYQTKGRGTNGKVWHGARDSCLLLSMILPLPKKMHYPIVSKLCAISVLDVLEDLGIEALFCYPNDILINGKKVCGILSEICERSMIVSLGLNLNQSIDDLKIIDQPATSLHIETGEIFDNDKILNLFLPIYIKNMKEVLAHNWEHFNSRIDLCFQDLRDCLKGC